MPAWQAPVCEDQSVSQRRSRWLPERSQRGQRRRVAVADRPQQDVVGEAVDLQQEQAGDLGLDDVAAPPRLALDHVAVPPFVLVDRQGVVDDRGRRREHDRDHDRGEHAADLGAGQEVDHEGDQQGVQDEAAEAEGEDVQRQREPRERRPDQGVEDADQRRREERAARPVEDEAGEEPGQHQQHRRVEHGDEDGPADPRRSQRLTPPRQRLAAESRYGDGRKQPSSPGGSDPDLDLAARARGRGRRTPAAARVSGRGRRRARPAG